MSSDMRAPIRRPMRTWRLALLMLVGLVIAGNGLVSLGSFGSSGGEWIAAAFVAVAAILLVVALTLRHLALKRFDAELGDSG